MKSTLPTGVRFSTLLMAFLLPAFAGAADRVLDLATGCKVYRLQNKAWVEVNASSMKNLGLSKSQILKDEKFTVFRTASGTFGVNQRCVKAGTGGGNQSFPATTVPSNAQKPRAAGKRRSAARPAEATDDSSSGPLGRGKWAAGFGLGMNLGPKLSISDPAGVVEVPLSSSIAFLGEAIYRMSFFRAVFELGLSQLQQSSLTGNEVSHFALRPEIPFSISDSLQVYVGPSFGLYFFAQNAGTDGTLTLKQQNAIAVLIGGKLGIDYAITKQFDIGLFLEYMKPGALTITGTDAGNPYEATLTTSYMTVGTRFVIYF